MRRIFFCYLVFRPCLRVRAMDFPVLSYESTDDLTKKTKNLTGVEARLGKEPQRHMAWTLRGT